MSIHGRAFDSAERAYLSPPEEEFPPGVEDALDQIVIFPEGTDEDSDVLDLGEVVGYECDEYMDPAVMEIKSLVDGRTVEVQINYLDEWEITDKLPPQVKAAAEAAEAVKRAEAELKRAQTVARNRAREAYKALAEAGLEELLVGQAQ